MKKWKDACVLQETKIFDALNVLDKTALRLLLVVDQKFKLYGTVTDGDIRRAILNRISLDLPINKIMNDSPFMIPVGMPQQEIIDIMVRESIYQLPVVNQNGEVIALEIMENLLSKPQEVGMPVIIMAGGMGTRLKELTKDCPKPLLKVGSKPLLETIIDNFKTQGFRNFYLAVNYKSQMIEDYFRNGEDKDISIKYLKEEFPLGTAGALSLLPKEINEPVIVMNGDVLTRINFCDLMSYHISNGADATMCVREYQHRIPYGVIETQDGLIADLIEKPTRTEFVNAGVYVLNSEIYKSIKHHEYLSMTDLFKNLVGQRKKSLVYALHEYWLDIGHAQAYEQANNDYGDLFDPKI